MYFITGTNSQGNDYRQFTDGGYSYRNRNEGVERGQPGSTSSTYHVTKSGHAFYENKAGGYGFHENPNTGVRTYHDTGKGGKK